MGQQCIYAQCDTSEESEQFQVPFKNLSKTLYTSITILKVREFFYHLGEMRKFNIWKHHCLGWELQCCGPQGPEESVEVC